ncbi:hypothetical protein ABR738_35855 [Streptomyces sp. Edi4]|uniref:hypothetical protein n=1 Tax=Streptomyces sp. Edi4 TaxID=3162527 RepID=UPI003305AC11
MTRHRSGLSRFLHDIVADIKDLLDDVTDSLGDVEHDTRASVSRALRPDDRDHRDRRDRRDDRDGERRRERYDDRAGDRADGFTSELTGLREELHRLVELLEKDEESTRAGAKTGSASK